jgi:pSer/pThr/pTyr-binding forkhead associated (FHA) protein
VPYLVGLQGLVAGTRFAITQDTTIVGRDGGVDIVVEDFSVSLKHIRLERGTEGRIDLFDESEREGVCINGTQVRQATLRHGDEIKVGDNHFVFEE